MTTKVKSPPKPKAQKEGRPKLYDEIIVQVCLGTYAITEERMKELVGYVNDPKEAKAKNLGDALYDDIEGKPVWFENNVRNRPLYMDQMETVEQELLNRRWRCNGETIIIGETGIILNGQHQGGGLLRACQRWRLDGDGKQWKALWPDGPPTMEKIIVYGIPESDDVVDTMDTCKPRSLTDVIYRSGLFGKAKGSDLRTLSRMLDSSVRMLWHRTGARLDAFAPRRTNAEGMDFVRHHPHTVRAVKHVWEEYQGGPANEDGAERPPSEHWTINNRSMGAGYAAALLYLMGCCTSDRTAYASMDVPGEKKLKWEEWELACEFFSRFAERHTALKGLFDSLGYLADPEHPNSAGGSLPERIALIVNAWNKYRVDQPITVKSLDLSACYDENDDTGIRRFARMPTVGGIDIGQAKVNRALGHPDADEVDGSGPADPTPEEVEEERQAAAPKAPPKPRKPPRPKKAVSLPESTPPEEVNEANEGQPLYTEE